MYIAEDILTGSEQRHLRRIADYEIRYHLCEEPDIPRYQSTATMQTKYRDDEVYQKLSQLVQTKCLELTGLHSSILRSWFNVCRRDSEFTFHQHTCSSLSAVYFLHNCLDNGTVLLVNNLQVKCLVNDNSLLFFNSQIPHTVPPWQGRTRYTIAFDLAV